MESGSVVEYRVTYDPVADALYVWVRDGEVADTVEVAEGVYAFLGPRGAWVTLIPLWTGS